MYPESNVEILIAEDSATQALSLQLLMQQQGYRVVVCENGKLALEAARRRRPTLVISDIVMPEMDGYAFCRALKADPELAAVPVLLVTTLSDPGDVLRGLEVGADAFILKPYDDTFLLNRIRFILLHRSLRQAERSDIGLEISFNGQTHFITSDRLQILNLLLSTYEAAMQRNEQLRRSEEELREVNSALSLANDRLGEQVRQREIAEAEVRRLSQDLIRATEAQLELSEQRYRELLDVVPAGIYSTDAEGRIVDYNRSAAEMWGKRPAPLESIQSFYEGYLIADSTGMPLSAEDQPMAKTLVDGTRLRNHAIAVERPDRTHIDALINVAPLRDADGNPAGAINCMLDVSELARSQRHLAASRQLAQATLDALTSRICVLDQQGRVLNINNSWRNALAANPGAPGAREGDHYAEACERSPIADTVAESARFLAGLREVLEGRRHAFKIEYSHVEADERCWSVARVSRFDAGGMVRFVVSHQDVTDRRRAEDRERESAALLDIAGEMARIGGWVYDVRAGRMSWSKEVAAIHEMQQAAAIEDAPQYSPSLDQAMEFYRENCPRIAECLDACVSEGEPFDEEVQMTTAAGGRRWVRAIGVAIKNDAGTIVRAQGAFQDISAIKSSEERVARIAERLTTTFESITDAFFTLDRNWEFTYVNREAERILQKTSEELLGQGIWEAFPEAVGTQIERQYVKAVAGNIAAQFETFYAPLDLWVDVHAYPSDEGLAVYFRDVTHRKHGEMALRKSEESLRLAIAASGLGTWRWDRATQRIHVSDQTMEMFGLARDAEMTFEAFLGSIHPDDRAEVTRHMQLSMETHSDFRADFRIVHPDGSVRWIAGLGRAHADEAHAGLRMEGVNLDITERKRSEQELVDLNERLEQRVEKRTEELAAATQQAEAANAAKSAFLAMMSHEIRTPMNGVIGMVDVIAHGELSPSQRDAMRTVRESAFALLALIDDILDFSKIEAGRLDLERKEVCLSELVEGVCDTLGPVAGRKGVDLFVFVSPSGSDWVWADPVRLRQILFNLVGNAIKFSGDRGDKRGRIDIRVELSEDAPHWVEFRVSDNGIGISPEAGSHLFESFRQAEVSTTRRYGGTGLGLAICKRLTDLMGGTIGFNSVVGEGTIFTVRVPLETASVANLPEVPDLRGLDFIVMPASNFQADDLRVYLASAGASVEVVAGPAEAAEACKRLIAPVVVHAGGDDPYDDRRQMFSEELDVPHLVVLQGRRRGARETDPGAVVIDGNSMRRRALLHAAAVAAGRASPDLEDRLVQVVMDEGVPMVAPTISEARRQGRVILVAEDDPTNQKVVLRQLELLGYAAEVAADGNEALRLWNSGSYALVLSDLHMPGLDGYGLVHEIRRGEPVGSRIPIIALTGNALRGEADRSLVAGFDEYLTKPTQLSLLRTVLHKWMPPATPDSGDARGGAVLVAAADSAPVHAIDIRVLRDLVGDDRGLWIDLLVEYRSGALSHLRELQAAMAASDWSEVVFLAHRLKSPSRTIGAMRLGDLCADIENEARAADEQAVAGIMVALEAALESVFASIDSFREEIPGESPRDAPDGGSP